MTRALAFDPTGSTLAVALRSIEDASAPAVELFDVASGRPVGSLTGPDGYYCVLLDYDPTGRWLGALGVDPRIRDAVVWDLAAGGDPEVVRPRRTTSSSAATAHRSSSERNGTG